MNKLLLICCAALVLAFTPRAALAESKYAALIGGSSRDPREKPFFRQHFDTFNQRLAARGWQTTILFSSGDPTLPAEPATNANIQQLLDSIAAKAARGDQVLFFFNGHGSRP